MKMTVQLSRVRRDYALIDIEASSVAEARKVIRRMKKEQLFEDDQFCDGDFAQIRIRVITPRPSVPAVSSAPSVSKRRPA